MAEYNIGMAATKRQYTDFGSFPGEINEAKQTYEFPRMVAKMDNGRTREWTIYARLITIESRNPAAKTPNWNTMLEDHVPMHKEYLDAGENVLDGLIAQVWSETGFVDGKLSRSAPSYVGPKNVGRSNYRNPLQEALVVARGKYEKKRDEGYRAATETDSRLARAQTKKFYPMLAKNYKDFVNRQDSLTLFPAYVQPKLDGMRCIAYLDKHDGATPADVVLYTRTMKEYPHSPTHDLIRRALFETLLAHWRGPSGEREPHGSPGESLYLDGEIYEHGVSLQSLNSIARSEDSKESVEYHVYDLFYPSYGKKDTFEQRTAFLAEVHAAMSDDAKAHIMLVPTHLVSNEQGCDALYSKYIAEGYEGIMVRAPGGEYAKSNMSKSALRSRNLLKRKEVFDAEFEVVDFTQGRQGKDAGALIWVAQTAAGGRFNVVPNMPLAARYTLFEECRGHFVGRYKHRMLRVEYRGLSDDGIPQHAKGIEFRDIV